MDIKSAQINQALGVFVLFFGCVVLYATTYTNTSVGFNTNLVAGLFLFLVGFGMWLKAKFDIKKLRK